MAIPKKRTVMPTTWVISKRCFFFSSRRRQTRWNCDWSSDVCSSDLGVDDADEQRAGQPGPGRYGDRVERRRREASFRECPIDDRREGRQMRATRQLGHDAAEDLVNVLGENDEARQLTVHENGGRSLVARRLNAEDGVSHDGAGLEAWRGAAG